MLTGRAEQVLAWIKMNKQETNKLWIRQATIAEQLGCSRSTICRAIKQLKETGHLLDLNQRHEHKYKIYELVFKEISKPIQPQKSSEQDIEQIWQEYGGIWKVRFPYMDGQSGRPLLEEFVPRFSKRLLELNPNSNKPLLQRLKPNLVQVARLAAQNYINEYGQRRFFEIGGFAPA